MKLRFLGTGAGELWPSAFCNCSACKDAIRECGKQARIGSCLLIDGRYLIDAPPNLGLAAVQRGVSLADVRHIFVTHSHQDHFDPCVLAATRGDTDYPIRVHCNERLFHLLSHYREFNRFFDPEKLGLESGILRPFDRICDGDSGASITALPADHDRTDGEEPLLFLFERGGKTLLYASDTGWFPDQTWGELEKHTYDVVILECTFHEIRPCRRGHLSLDPFLEIKSRFESEGLLKTGCRFIAQHIGHVHGSDDPPHDALAAKLHQRGVDLAWDDMALEV